nr:MAG TPA: hypothetical protein [Bacteriophage sp.]
MCQAFCKFHERCQVLPSIVRPQLHDQMHLLDKTLVLYYHAIWAIKANLSASKRLLSSSR